MATVEELTAIPEGETPSSTFVKIIHPETGDIGEVAVSALPIWYRSGWRLLQPDEVAAAAEPGPPAPVSEQDVQNAAEPEPAALAEPADVKASSKSK